MQQTLSVNLNIVIDSVLQFAPATLPHAVVGVAYPATSVGTPSGGVAPYTFSVVSGMPAGMSLSSSGVLSGTPTGSPGSSTVVIHVTDSGS